MLLVEAAPQAKDIAIREIVVPTYPHLAWLARLQGSLEMDLQVGQDGEVQSAKVQGAHPLLREESEKNIRSWTSSSLLRNRLNEASGARAAGAALLRLLEFASTSISCEDVFGGE